MISTNQDHKDQFTIVQTLATSKNTLLPAVNNLLNPSASQTRCRNHCTNPITTPYVIWVPKQQTQIIKPMEFATTHSQYKELS